MMENRDVVLARERSSSHNGVASAMGVIAPDIIPLPCVLKGAECVVEWTVMVGAYLPIRHEVKMDRFPNTGMDGNKEKDP